MTTHEVHLPRPHPGQATVIDEARRFNVLACGRRFGKSTLGVDRLIGPALEGYPVAWFSPTYRMLVEVWRDVRRTLTPIATRISTQEHRIELMTGGLVDMWSLDTPDVARGRKYKRIVIDEAAMIAHLEDAWQAVIRPTLADFQGDGWILSTPKGRNMFHRMFSWGQDPEQTDWACWQMPTAANPYIAPAEIAAMQYALPERTYAQEVLAQFLEDEGAVFRRVLTCATLPGVAIPDPQRPRQTVMGVDWGKSNDFTVLVVLDVDTGEVVDYDRFNQIDWHFQRARLRGLWERWRCTSILAERNSIGEPNIEELQRDGLPVMGFQTTNTSKATAIEALALAIENGRIIYPKIPEVINELQAFEMKRLPSGLMRYEAPEGMHDDIVIALALAWQAGSGDYQIGALPSDLADALTGYRGF